jgi:Flp pilus assembly protein TadG
MTTRLVCLQRSLGRLAAMTGGNSAVEFALAAPLLILLALGAFDYGRSYVEAFV